MKLKATSFVFALSLCLGLSAIAQEKPKTNAKEDAAKIEVQEPDEDEELRKAIEGSGGSEQQMLENLEAFLKKYPTSSRRDEIERELYKMAGNIRDKNRQITYAEKLVASNPQDLEKMTFLVSTLRDRKGTGDLAKALSYGDKLVKAVEDIFASRIKPARMSPGQWEQQKGRTIASVYLLRGQIHNDLGNLDQAESDLHKSYKQSPLASAAATLAAIAEKRKNTDQAIDYYLQAFIRSIEAPEGADRDEIRRKLGQLYTAKNGSEQGLGDKLLKTYDVITKDNAERLAKIEPPNPNENVTNPLEYKLTKLNGGDVRLSDYKGKVIITNFWATWCGPCRIEMPELERAMEKYKNDKDVIFLAINTDDDRNYVEPYVKGQKIKLPVVYANYLDAEFRVTSIPTTIIFDRQGQVAFRQAGFNSREDFVAMISEKIEAAKKR
ncbi:MAG: TlpA family protein disulfide reductase [Acidobacteria bacterium]|nr:TlpA family protein disulfide reductase [Acidobacteriota bacterium]